MKKTHHFQLDVAISAWRQSLQHERFVLSEDLDELEQHIRDQVEYLVSQDYDQQSAFQCALEAMGSHEETKAAYQKVYWGKLKRKRKLKDEVIWSISMIKNYALVALRNFRKQKMYAAINLAGLTIGVACCLLIFLFIQDELNFDRFHEKVDRIYRVVITGNFAGSEIGAPMAPAPMAAKLVSDFPQIKSGTRIFGFIEEIKVNRDEQNFVEESFYYVDPTFFDVFTFAFLQGDPQTALAKPNSLVLTESMARKYFGDENPMGQTLVLADTSTYHITGLLADIPPNSHLQFDFLGSLESIADSRSTIWFSNSYFTYLELDQGADPAAIEAQLPAFFRRYAGPQMLEAMGIEYDKFLETGNRLDYSLQALTDIHLYSHMQFELSANSDIKYVYLFSVIAIFILLIACFNFMNLATARSLGRSKEVGIRKALGSSRGQLIRQFLTESMLLSFMASSMAIVLVVIMLPSMNNLVGRSISISSLENGLMWLGLLVFTVGVGLVSGSYPAFFLSSFRPVLVLKGTLQQNAKRPWLRNGLVIFQFAISIALIAGTLVVYTQLNYMSQKNLGFDKEHVVVIHRAQELNQQTESFKQTLRNNAGITSASSTSFVPGGFTGRSAFRPKEITGEELYIMTPVLADHDYVKTLGLDIVDGRDFSRTFTSDSTGYLINETAVRTLNLQTPVGQLLDQVADSITTGQVLGVIKDFHFTSLHQDIGALTLQIANEPLPYIAVRMHPNDIPGTLTFIEQTWNEFSPSLPFEYSFLGNDFDALNRAEQRLGVIFIAFALFSVLIACLGLFGLSSFITERRTKEIGVRKVLGASVLQLVFLLSREFTILVGIAFLIAVPVAYFAMRDWLQGFAYRVSIGIEVFLLVGILALILAWVTVGYQSIKAALSNPVESLRYE